MLPNNAYPSSSNRHPALISTGDGLRTRHPAPDLDLHGAKVPSSRAVYLGSNLESGVGEEISSRGGFLSAGESRLGGVAGKEESRNSPGRGTGRLVDGKMINKANEEM